MVVLSPQARGAFACVALLLMMAGCATVPVSPAPSVQALADVPFSADGRISARHGNDAVSANFRWEHTAARDQLELATPLGQTVAQLDGDASRAEVRLPDGRTLAATDWTALTERALGIPIPVVGLSAWVRGGPHGGSAFSTEPDGRGRISLLRQDGWEIVFDYADPPEARPSRLRMTYPGGVEIRLVVDRLE